MRSTVSMVAGVVVIALALASMVLWSAREIRRLRAQAPAAAFLGDPPTVADPMIGFQPNPGSLHWYHPPGTPRDLLVEVATNLDGHRVAADRRWEHDGPADVVAVGCSFTFGFGVNTDEAFPARLAHILGRPVVNAGVPAYGTVGSQEALRRALPARPRVIVYGLVDVHLERNVRPCAPAWTPYCRPQGRVVRDHEGTLAIAPPHGHVLGEDGGSWVMQNVMSPPGWRDVMRGLPTMLAIGLSRLVMPAWDESPEVETAAMRYLLERMSADARDVGATLVVLYIPLGLPGAGEPRAFVRPAEALRGAIPRSVITVDSRPALRTAPIEVSLRVSDLDRHPNAAAHALIADAVAPTVRSLLSRAEVGTDVP